MLQTKTWLEQPLCVTCNITFALCNGQLSVNDSNFLLEYENSQQTKAIETERERIEGTLAATLSACWMYATQ